MSAGFAIYPSVESKGPSGPKSMLRPSGSRPKCSRKLGYFLFQQHQRCADALDLLGRQIAAVNPPNGLTLHPAGEATRPG